MPVFVAFCDKMVNNKMLAFLQIEAPLISRIRFPSNKINANENCREKSFLLFCNVFVLSCVKGKRKDASE